MKVLLLIISSPSVDPVYIKLKDVWRSYMNNNSEIESYFIEYNATKDRIIENNTFYIKGSESYNPGVREKTIDSFDYFLKSGAKYDYVVRTNISSVWNFRTLLKYLSTLPQSNVYSGIIGYHNNIRFVSGAGFIMSPDIVQRIIDNRTMTHHINIMDDVDIGAVLDRLGTPFTLGSRTDLITMDMFNNYVYDDNVYHYRIKQESHGARHEEPVIMKKILDMINPVCV